MVRKGSAVTFTGVDKLAESIEAHDRKVKRVIAGQFLYAKNDAETFARLNAPWTDRTGNARAGLHANVNVINQGEAFELIVAHSVPYGIWLEVRFSGKYAIIQPTVDYIGQILIQRLASSIQKLEAMSA
jgi:hypothetical protein